MAGAGRAVFVAIVALWLGGAPASNVARAQGPASSDLAQPGADGLAELRRPILSPPEYSTLRAAWSEVQSDLGRKAWAEAAGRLQHLVAIRGDLGLRDLYPMSAALLYAAREASAEGATDAAGALVAAAVTLSPHLPAARFEEAVQAFQDAPLGLGAQLRALRGGFERLPEDPAAATAFAGNALSALALTLTGLLIAFGLAMALRYASLAVGDLRRALFGTVDRLQATVLLTSVLAAPFLAGFGLLGAAAVWLVVAAAYLKVTERVVAALLLLAVAALPWLTGRLVASAELPGVAATVLHRCNHSLCAPEDRRHLATWAAGDRLGYEASFTLALVEKRARGMHASDAADPRPHAVRAATLQRSPQALLLLGNIEYLDALSLCEAVKGDDAQATEAYDKHLRAALALWDEALEAAPRFLPALYNAAIARRQLGAEGEADKLLSAAMQADAPHVNHWNKEIAQDANLSRCRSARLANRHLMDAPLPAATLRTARLTPPPAEAAVILPVGGVLAGNLDGQAVLAGGLAAALWVALAWLLRGSVGVSVACQACGATAGPRQRVDVRGGALCEACIKADIQRGLVDAKEQWFREQRLRVQASRRARLPRLVTWVLPGFGHLLKGAPLRGVAYLVLVFGSLMVGLGLHTIFHDPHAPLAGGGARLTLFGGLAVIAWLVALIDAHTGKEAA